MTAINKPLVIPLNGHAPDKDPTEPGVFSYCLGVEPSPSGWKLQRAMSQVATTSGAAWTSGSYILDGLHSKTIDGTDVVHIAIYDAGASKTKIFRLNGAALTDASVAGNYTQSSNFSFAQYGNYTLATNLTEVVQYRDATTATAFAATGATGIPKAKICVTWGPANSQRVMLLDYDDGTHYADGWWTSHQGGPLASWVPDIATAAANGRLLGTFTIRCGIAFGEDCIVFSAADMWRGTFVGPPVVVDWRLIPNGHGCLGQYAACVESGVLYWVSRNGLHIYDGSNIATAQWPIQGELRTALNNATNNLQLNIQAWSSRTGTVLGRRIMLVTKTNATTATQAIATWYVLDIDTGKVGKRSPIATGATSYQLLMNNGYAAYLVTGGEAVLMLESTTPFAAALTDLYGFGLSYIGSNKGEVLLSEVIPRFVTAPVTYKCTNYHGVSASEALNNTTTAQTVTASPWRATPLQADRFHAPRLHFSSDGTVDMETLDVLCMVQDAGRA